MYLFFEVINDLLNMRAKFITDWMNDVLDKVLKIEPNEEGEEKNTLKNMETLLVMLIAIALAIVLALGLGLLVYYVPR